jgi:hypothetical protein
VSEKLIDKPFLKINDQTIKLKFIKHEDGTLSVFGECFLKGMKMDECYLFNLSSKGISTKTRKIWARGELHICGFDTDESGDLAVNDLCTYVV